MRRRSDATRVPPLPLPSSPRYIFASFSLAARLLRVEMKIYVSAGCIRQFLPSPFFRTFTYSRGFIVGLDLYRKLNGEMKNRGKKLQVLNSEKCDEITRNVCTFRNIRVTAKGKRENIFFHFICIYIYIFFWKKPDDTTLAYTFVRIERIDKICQTSARRFFFFLYSKN